MSGYKKPYLTFEQQLDLLKQRGLEVTDDSRAVDCLRRVGYYRLSAYWYPFRVLSISQDPGTGALSHRREDEFVEGARFQDVVALYVFDKHLRMLLADALERIEVAVRVSVAYLLGGRDPFAHMNPGELHGNFARRVDPKTGATRHSAWMHRYSELCHRSREDFAKHYRVKYGEPFPIWVAIELWDFGLLSSFFSGMNAADKDEIARQYRIADGQIMTSWLRTLSYVRNLVAHHSRVWNRDFIDQPRLPRVGQMPQFDHCVGHPELISRVYIALCICLHFLQTINPSSEWRARVVNHISALPNAPGLGLRAMGFPERWKQEQLWD